MDIVWTTPTEFFSVINDPRYETGWRENPMPRPDSHPQDSEFKQIHQQFFSDGPKLKFVPSQTFAGPLPGYVFYLGQFGIGYYIDPLIMRQVIYA